MPIVNVDILAASVATPPSGSTTLFTDAGALKVKKDTGAVDVITEHRADNLTGTTLADNVVNSLLTSVGTLGVLGVTGTVTAGSFSGPLTGNVTGNVSGTSGSTTGNAATATALQTPRAINGTNFDGTGPITVTAAAGTLTGNTLAAGVTASSLTSLGTQTGLTCSGQVLLTLSGSVGVPTLEMSSAQPILAFNESDQSANERRWAVGAIGKALQFRASTDDGSTSVIWATVTRGTGTAITDIAIGDTTNNNTYTFSSTGTATFSGAVAVGSLATAAAFVPSGSTVPTNGFYLPAANTVAVSTNSAHRWRVDSNGNFLLGATSAAGVSLRNSKDITGSTQAYANYNDGTVRSGVTGSANYFASIATTEAAAFNITNIRHYTTFQNALGSGSSATNQIAFYASATLTGATNNYGFSGDIPSGANRWNAYMGGTAQNYFAGNVGIGSGKSAPATALDVNGVVTVSGGLYIPADSVELRIGAGNDLRFSHDGTNSIIENNTGVLRILSGGDLRLEEGQVALQTVGKGLSIKEGANAKQGLTGNLVAGSLVVNNTSVTANSRIQLTRETPGGTLGHISYSKTAGVSFTITSTSATETSTFVYSIFEVS